MPDIQATIFSIQKFSTEDGPGIRTTVFFKGCPMRCPWCHNPEAVRSQPDLVWHGGRCIGHGSCLDACPEGALKAEAAGIAIDRLRCNACRACVEACPSAALEIHGYTLPVDDLFARVARDASFYGASGGGVTLSGGEPLAQPKAAIALLKRLRDAGIQTALDTCGAVSEKALAEALPFTDLVLFDVKSVDPERHEALTGVSQEWVARSARIVNDSGVPVWVRSPIIPGHTDGVEAVRGVARFVAQTFANCRRHDLLAFSNLCVSKYDQLDKAFPLEKVPLLERETMEALCEAARQAGSATAQWSGPTRLEKAVN